MVLFDEIEKGRFLSLERAAADHRGGRLTTVWASVDFRNTVVIMTSNIAPARRSKGGSPGFLGMGAEDIDDHSDGPRVGEPETYLPARITEPH